MTEPGASTTEDTSPCVGCAMCCDGTLYWIAKVDPGEEARISGHGLELTEENERTYFRLPCAHEVCGRCAIYETRFNVCKSFRCKLLRRYQSGEIDGPTALDHVATAKELLAAVTTDDPSAATAFSRRDIRLRLSEELKAKAEGDQVSRARQLVNIVALDTYLERWFRNPKSDEQAQDEGGKSPSNA